MSDQNGGIEHRQSPRVDYEVSIDLESDDRFFTGFVRNISHGGLFITTDRPLPIGMKLVVRFSVPTLKEPVTATAEVRWVRKARPDSGEVLAGVGVQFTDLDPAVSAALDAFIKQHDTLFWE